MGNVLTLFFQKPLDVNSKSVKGGDEILVRTGNPDSEEGSIRLAERIVKDVLVEGYDFDVRRTEDRDIPYIFARRAA
tara:strand:+ start:274 stop:504 length:231 start_codon:yes stop_codon:yes gene_type:complete